MKDIKYMLPQRFVRTVLVCTIPVRLHSFISVVPKPKSMWDSHAGRPVRKVASAERSFAIKWEQGHGVYDYMQLLACLILKHGMDGAARGEWTKQMYQMQHVVVL